MKPGEYKKLKEIKVHLNEIINKYHLNDNADFIELQKEIRYLMNWHLFNDYKTSLKDAAIIEELTRNRHTEFIEYMDNFVKKYEHIYDTKKC